MEKEYITLAEYCRARKIEESFVIRLEQGGLIEIHHMQEEAFLHSSQLSALERFSEWHYELEIGTPGIEAVHHLVQRVESLQEEIRRLKERLEEE